MTDETANWFYDPNVAFKGSHRDGHGIVASLQMGVSLKKNPPYELIGEWRIAWHDLHAKGSESVARLEAFEDGWNALFNSGLIEILSELVETCEKNPQINDVMIACRNAGWVDVTKKLESDV
jgi:hypothetical protein